LNFPTAQEGYCLLVSLIRVFSDNKLTCVGGICVGGEGRSEPKRDASRGGFGIDTLRKGFSMIPVPVRDWSEAIVTSTAPALGLLLTGLARAIAFLVIVVIGWALASLFGKAIGALLRNLRFNDLAARSGFAGFIRSAGFEGEAAGLIGTLTKWFIRLAALVVAFDVLGLPGVSDFVRQVLLWLPNLAVGVAILIIGGLVANVLAGVVRGATTRFEIVSPALMATITRVAVWAVAVIVAVNQVGVGREVVNTLFIAVVGAAALATGLAFGLGGRETAADIVRQWYARTQIALPPSGKAMESIQSADRPH
jgi:hypothetical protein